MRGAGEAAALHETSEIAQPPLDIALAAAEMNNRHLSRLGAFCRRHFRRALAKVAAQRRRHQARERIEGKNSIRLGRKSERQQQPTALPLDTDTSNASPSSRASAGITHRSRASSRT